MTSGDHEPILERSVACTRRDSARQLLRPNEPRLFIHGAAIACNRVSERHECDADALEFVEQQNEVSQVPAQAVEPPANEHIELPAFCCLEEFIERRTTLLRARDAAVYELRSVPASAFHVTAQLLELVLDVLLERRDASVDSRSHLETRSAAASASCSAYA